MVSRTLTWKGDDRFVLGETTFHILMRLDQRPSLREGEFFIFKPRGLVDRYVSLIGALQPHRLFELGIFEGGSTLFFAKLARPQRIVAIDREPLQDTRDRLERHASAAGLTDAVRTFGEVDQDDRSRLAQIAEDAFDGDPLDLVVDDCSHFYDETRASFNELFPRLRPGGAYVIEDWRWAHTALGEGSLDGMYPDRVPLTRLLFEIVLAIPALPGLVSQISIETEFALITRGDATVDPATFDVGTCSNPRGRALLAPG